MKQVRVNVYRIPRHFNWPFVIGGFALLALIIMLPRWGGTIEDSQAYFDTARWLRGDAPPSSLRAPFPYRIGVPALAAALPGPVRHTFALLNWLFVTAGACLATATVRRLGFGTPRALAAGLLVIVSLPTFWYAPYLLVDPGSVCMRMLFVFGVLTGQPGLALAAGLGATAIREENILLIVWLVALRRVGVGRGLAALALALAWLVAVRWWIVPPLPHYAWVPNLDAVRKLFGDWRALASLAGCAGLVVPLALAGMRGAPERLRPLMGLLLLMALPPLYAALSVRVEGRIVWGLYPFLVPFAVAHGLRGRDVRAPEGQPVEPRKSPRSLKSLKSLKSLSRRT
jgi:hypothetical protein